MRKNKKTGSNSNKTATPKKCTTYEELVGAEEGEVESVHWNVGRFRLEHKDTGVLYELPAIRVELRIADVRKLIAVRNWNFRILDPAAEKTTTGMLIIYPDDEPRSTLLVVEDLEDKAIAPILKVMRQRGIVCLEVWGTLGTDDDDDNVLEKKTIRWMIDLLSEKTYFTSILDGWVGEH